MADGHRCSSSVPGVGGPVPEDRRGRRIRVERLPDMGADQYTANWRVPGGDSLGEGDKIRLHAVTLRGKHCPRAAESRDDLVEDEKDVVAPADLPDCFKVSRCGWIHATCPLDGFSDDGGNVVSTDLCNRVGHPSGVVGRHPCRLGDQGIRAVPLPVELQAGDARAIRVKTVVGELTAEDHLLVPQAFALPMPARQFAGRVNGIRSA